MCSVHAFLHRRVARPAFAVLFAVTLALPAAQAHGRDDHERALRAVQSGQALPLREVLERLAREQPGEVLEVELEQEDGRWIYELKLLQPDGQLLKLEVDARTAAVLRRKTRPMPH